MLHSPFSVISTNLAGMITDINPAGERLVGYAAVELIQRSNILLLHDPAELALRCSEASENSGAAVMPLDLLTEAVKNDVSEVEWHYIRKDGTRVPVGIVVSVLKNSDGEATGLIHMGYDISTRKRTEQEIRHMALHDPLTGLPNRNLMTDRVQMAIRRAARNRQMVGVMLLDLDKFKEINDQLGHHVGDGVLQAVANRISGAVRQIDTVIRTGGDEFVVLLGELQSSEDAARIATSVVTAMHAELRIDTHRLQLSASIGVAIYPNHGDNLDTLLQVADQAMYSVKKSGGNGQLLTDL
ncbi:MAG: hypothetical protein CMK99_23080 [Pseudomonas sp.]|nr:hypothetical protein [Pseudomonas sp.]